MFLEPQATKENKGWIEVICGSMFSGKTEELIRRLKRAQYAGLKVEIFKPQLDNRYSEQFVVSHNQNQISSTPVANASEILLFAEDTRVVGIDEAQFFDEELVQVANQLANKGKRIVIAGLDMDYLSKPFGPIPKLMATAEYVTKLHAICMCCGQLASHSHRISSEDDQVVLGEKNNYEPLCRRCYNLKTSLEQTEK